MMTSLESDLGHQNLYRGIGLWLKINLIELDVCLFSQVAVVLTKLVVYICAGEGWVCHVSEVQHWSSFACGTLSEYNHDFVGNCRVVDFE